MTEIGATLREARMRAGIDITEVERATKIRTKYLRALEDEEWGVLPGSTFVKSFLRTYGDYLGLDSRLLVEEFKRRYEKPAETEISPLGATRRRREPRREPRRSLTPILVGVVLLALFGGLFALGTLRKDDSGTKSTTNSSSTAKKQVKRRTRSKPAASADVRVQLVATGPVYACVVDGTGRKLVAGQTLAAGQSTPTFRARRILLTIGNAAVRLRVDGKDVTVPQSSRPISYELTSRGRRTLTSAQAPSCA